MSPCCDTASSPDALTRTSGELTRQASSVVIDSEQFGQQGAEHRLAATSSEAECSGGCRVGVGEEVRGALGLVVLTDRDGRAVQRRERTQKALVGRVRPRHGAEALPAAAAQLVETAVVAGAGVGVGGDGVSVTESAFGEHGPREARRRMRGSYVSRVYPTIQERAHRFLWQQSGFGS